MRFLVNLPAEAQGSGSCGSRAPGVVPFLPYLEDVVALFGEKTQRILRHNQLSPHVDHAREEISLFRGSQRYREESS